MGDTTKYAGQQFYALVTRSGGCYRTIRALAVYKFRSNGVPYKVGQAMNCVANKSQWAAMRDLTKNCGFVEGRPTFAKMQKLTDNELSKLVSQLGS